MTDANDYLSGLFGNGSGVGAVDAYGKNVAAGAAQGALSAGQAGTRMTDLYMKDYQPYDKKFMGYVDSIGTDAYRAQQRGQAMTGVQQQIDAQKQAQGRQMAAMGVNPNSARFAATNGLLAQQGALSKTMAGMGADRNAREEWKSGLGAINAMGLKMGELGTKNMAVASDLGRTGLAAADLGAAAGDRNTQAGASATSAGAAAMNASTASARMGQDQAQFDKNYGLNLGKLALDREALTSGNYLKQQGIDATNSTNSFGNTLVSGLAGAGTKYLFSKDGMQTMSNLLNGGSSNLPASNGWTWGQDFVDF